MISKINPKKIAYFSLFGVFVLFNIIIFYLSVFVFSLDASVLESVYKWFQFLSFSLLVLLVFSYVNKILAVSIFALIYFITISLYFLSFISYQNLSFEFISSYISQIYKISSLILKPTLIVLFFAALSVLLFIPFVKKIQRLKFKKIAVISSFLLIVIFAPYLFGCKSCEGKVIRFARSVYAYQRTQVLDLYANTYDDLHKLAQKRSGSWSVNKQPPEYLQNVVILELESLNSLAMNKKTTPNFFKYSKQGVRFDRYYSNSMQTIPAQKNILCSLPTALQNNNKTYSNVEGVCLPQFLDQIGYNSYFYTAYSTQFKNTKNLMRTAGFDKIYHDDITKRGDPINAWGYREDVFVDRVFSNLKNKNKKRNLIYITLGPSNHIPFKVPEEKIDEVPYPNASSYKKRIKNTLHLQDKNIPEVVSKLRELYGQNFTLFIVGDTSYPVGLKHEQNKSNERNAHEENFRTEMAIIPGGSWSYSEGKVINKSFSHMDILPSIVDMFGDKLSGEPFSKSFVSNMSSSSKKNNTNKNTRKILNIQPYGDKYINIIDANTKFQYNHFYETITKFKLGNNFSEQKIKIMSKNENKNLKILKDLLTNNFE